MLGYRQARSPGPAARKAFSPPDGRPCRMKSVIRFKERILSLTRRQVLQAAETYFDPDRHRQAVAVISGDTQLKEANEKIGEDRLSLFRI